MDTICTIGAVRTVGAFGVAAAGTGGTITSAGARPVRCLPRARTRRWPTGRPGRPGGLALDLPDRFLDDAFGAGAVVRFEDIDFPATLTHGPTRRFLGEVGLPERGYGFELDTDVPLPTLTEYHADLRAGESTAPRLPCASDQLIRLGALRPGTALVLDGATGAVLCWGEGDRTPHPLTADLSTLTVTVWLLHRERHVTGGLRGRR
jgi:hypothetical protein